MASMQTSNSGDAKPVQFAPKKYGSLGKEKFRTNFFKIELIADSPSIFHYNIEIIPKRFDPQSSDVNSCESPTVPPLGAVAKAPVAQSGKPKGKGRKAAAAKKAGIDLTSYRPVASTSRPVQVAQAAGANDQVAAANDQAAGANGTKKPDESSEPAKMLKNRPAPKHLQNDIFRAVFDSKLECLPAFDGRKNFYSIVELNLAGKSSWTKIIEVDNTGSIMVDNNQRKERYQVNITVPKDSNLPKFSALLKKDNRLMPFELQALDIVLRNGPRIKKVAIGPKLFRKFNDPDLSDKKSLRLNIGSGSLKYIQFGYYLSARKAEDGLYCNVDRAMAIFTQGGALIKLIDLIVPGASVTEEPLSPEKIQKISAELKGLSFTSRHLPYVRAFFITGVTDQPVKTVNFQEEGKENKTTVLEYFKNKYPDFIRKQGFNENLPCVKYGPKRFPKFMPIECVELLADEQYRRKLNPVQQAYVTRACSQQSPVDRFDGIKSNTLSILEDNIIKHPDGEAVDYLKKFGIKIITTPTVVEGRVLPAPVLLYGNSKQVQVKKGQYEVDINDNFFKPTTKAIGKDWAVINFMGQFKEGNIDNLIEKLIEQAEKRGISMEKPKLIEKSCAYPQKGSLENLFNELGKLGIQFAIFVFSKNDEIYNEIKTRAEVEEFGHGLVTQCLSQDKKYWGDEKLFPQFISNILLEINAKFGGTNQSIQLDGGPTILTKKKKTMFMGLDVTHSTSASDNLRHSIAAVVATYTDEFDKVFTRTKIQEKERKELIKVKQITKELLESYQEVNKCYPEKIVVYRDGVGEGDFEKVVRFELGEMKEACKELKQQILFTYIMVQKRHNFRFIRADAKPKDIRAGAKPKDSPAFQNVEPGSCIDRKITNIELFEFYLCSHAGALGTSVPGKYVVLADENDLTADDIQKMTYWLCHTYPRCQKTASLPPTVWYAHLLAERANKYLAHFQKNDEGSSISGYQADKLSDAEIRELQTHITVHPNLNGCLHFI